MSYLIAGGAGFIGANYIRFLLSQEPDAQVINLDMLSCPPARATVEELECFPGHTFVQGDIRDAALVRSLVDNADVLINFAAQSHVDRSIADAPPFADTNVGGTTVLLQAAAAAGVDRFVHISTDEVYGPILTGAAGEDAPLRPTSPYAAAKAGADLMVGAFAATFDYRAIIARPCNNLGPYQFPEKLIPRFVTGLLQGRSVPLYGDGQHQRDWLSVDDTCAAIDLLVQSGTPGDIYNISAGNLMANEQLAHRLVDLLGQDRSLIERVPDRPGHDRRYATDSTKLRALGWGPTTSFDQALADTVAWYERRSDWWEPFMEILD
jgi:dTDP-glucose 4,6-dehydratase